MITGNEGILGKASEAKEKQEKANIDDRRALAAFEASTNIENFEYTDKAGKTATIPAGFAPTRIEGEDTVEGGLVIIDSVGNEFVWVPVLEEELENMIKLKSGSTTNYEGILNNWSGTGNYSGTFASGNPLTGGSSYREPDVLTGNVNIKRCKN